MIVGTGIDIVEVARVKALMERYGKRFLSRWFTKAEIEYCEGKAKPHLHFASRLAAKEAVFKALRLHPRTPLCWKDIVVVRGEEGSPTIVLGGEPRATADRLLVTSLHVSLSHCDAYAVASVTAERDDTH